MWIPGIGDWLLGSWKKSNNPVRKYMQLVWVSLMLTLGVVAGIGIAIYETLWGLLLTALCLPTLIDYWVHIVKWQRGRMKGHDKLPDI